MAAFLRPHQVRAAVRRAPCRPLSSAGQSPNGASGTAPRIALALSGGGFRASIFHLGVFRRVAELGLLPQIDVMSTVSGGSIIGAFACQRWNAVLKGGADWKAFDREVSAPFLELITSRSFLLAWLRKIPATVLKPRCETRFSRTAVAAEVYDEWFFGGARLNSLPPHPLLVLNATSLPSIRAWRFTRDGMGDSRYGYADWAKNPNAAMHLSTAVVASAAFPPVFVPLRIPLDRYGFSDPPYGEGRPDVTGEMPLTDGGVYDNMALEVLTEAKPLPGGGKLSPSRLLVVSDGGQPARYRFRASRLPVWSSLTLLGRVRDIALTQVATQRRRNLVAEFRSAQRQGIMVYIGSRIDSLPQREQEIYTTAVGRDYHIPPSLVALIQTVRTSLDRFSRVECEAVGYHAYSLADAFFRAYPPSGLPQSNQPTEWLLRFDEQRISRWREGLATSSSVLRLR